MTAPQQGPQPGVQHTPGCGVQHTPGNGVQHTPGNGPLHGVRVLELAGLGPAPFAGMLLADLGADVLRVDRPGGGGGLLGVNADVLGRGRRSVVIDLKAPAGMELAHRLAARADVLVEGFRPGVAERLGLGPQECLAANPALVYARVTGWGQSGPLAPRAGHDITYLALSGALGAIGPPERPVIPLNLVADFGGGGMLLVVGVLAALLVARSSGVGQVVDAAMLDGVGLLLAGVHGLQGLGAWQDERGANLLDGGAPFYDVYRTSDDRFVAVGALEPQFFAALLAGLGLTGTLGEQYDRSRWPEMRAALAAAFARHPRDYWEEIFAGTDACVAPVLTLSEARRHPQARARGAFVEVDGVEVPAPAPRFSRTPAAVPAAPPTVGEHTRDALLDWGVPAAEVTDLLRRGVLATQPDRVGEAGSQTSA